MLRVCKLSSSIILNWRERPRMPRASQEASLARNLPRRFSTSRVRGGHLGFGRLEGRAHPGHLPPSRRGVQTASRRFHHQLEVLVVVDAGGDVRVTIPGIQLAKGLSYKPAPKRIKRAPNDPDELIIVNIARVVLVKVAKHQVCIFFRDRDAVVPQGLSELRGASRSRSHHHP